MAVRTISTSIKLDGEQEFKKQMSSVNSELKTLKSDMALVTAEFKGNANSLDALTAKGRVLQQQYAQQAEKVKALEKAVADASDAYGEADKRTDDYTRQLNYAKAALADLNREIQDNERYLDEAKRSADQCASSIDEYGREVKAAAQDSGGMSFSSPLSGLDDMVGKLGSLKGALLGGAAVSAVVSGAQTLAGAITDIVDSSEEYRKVMGTLEVSSQAAGYTAEQTAQTYERLYSVLGDNQTAATTTANLQAIGLSQEQLMTITDSAIGAWARYGDSIPIDSLAESINESIRCGEVTGTLADVLNWGSQEGETFGVTMRESTEANKEWNEAVLNAKTAEDYFNLALSQCSTDAERADLVLQTLTKQGLAQAGQAWIDTNGDIVAANESQAKFEEAQAKLGEKLAPIRDSLRDLGTAGFNFLADAIDGVSQAMQDVGDWWDRTWKDLKNGWDDFWAGPNTSGSSRGTGFDGSHAGGLAYVPWDGYIAQLHQGERVLTAEQARTMDALFSGAGKQPAGVTVADLRSVTASAVNAMGAMGGTGGRYVIELHWNVNGKELYRETIEDFRAVNKEIPEVLDDR